ncbi:MAG: hypothetical protein ABR499_07105 [Gemmatimonadaceae bacterium]
MRASTAAAVIVLLSAGALAAQAPSSGPLVLRLPASARGLALGGAGVAGRDDDVLFSNPAQLAVVRGTTISAQRYAPGNASGAISTVFAFAGGGIGVGAQWLGFSTDDLNFPYSAAALQSRGSSTASSAAATVGVGRVFKGVRFGIAGKIAQESAPRARSTSGFVDLGAEKDFRQFFGVGLSVQNVAFDGKALTRFTVGTQAEAPLVLLIPASPFIDVGLAAQVTVLHDGWLKPAGGAELGLAWIQGYSLTLRAGARRPEPGERPFTAGVGLNADRVRFDYALETREGGDVAHRVGIRVR